MVCAPVRSIIPSVKLGDYLSVQAHKLCSISDFLLRSFITFGKAFNCLSLPGYSTRVFFNIVSYQASLG